MRIQGMLLTLTLAVLLGAVATAAPDKDREVDRLGEQIHSLLQQADELRAAGQHDAAREKVARAEQIERRLAEHLAEERRKDYGEAELKKIMQGLEHGIGALKALGKNDLAEALARVAKEVRGRREGPREEDAKKQIEIMQMAMKAFREKDRHDAAERVERAIHAFKLSLAGRRDQEANEIRERAPKRPELAELMARAGEIYRELRMIDRAEMVEGLGRRLAGRTEGRKPDTEREAPERMNARHILEVLGNAKHGLLEAERRDLAEKVEHLMHAMELSLEGRHDEEAQRIINSAPRGEGMAEILMFAADQWEGFGHETKAETIRKLVREWQGRRGNEQGGREQKVADLEAQIAELAEMMRRLQKDIEAMKRELR